MACRTSQGAPQQVLRLSEAQSRQGALQAASARQTRRARSCDRVRDASGRPFRALAGVGQADFGERADAGARTSVSSGDGCLAIAATPGRLQHQPVARPDVDLADVAEHLDAAIGAFDVVAARLTG